MMVFQAILFIFLPLSTGWTTEQNDQDTDLHSRQMSNTSIKTTITLKPDSPFLSHGILTIRPQDIGFCEYLMVEDPSGLVEKIYDNFLRENTSLKILELRDFPRLKTIGRNFLAYTNDLEKVVLPDLPFLGSIEEGFLYRSTGLKSFHLPATPLLQGIGPNFLGGCYNLTGVTFHGLPKVKTIHENFLVRCTNLEAIELPNLPKISLIGKDFLSTCSKLKILTLTGGPNGIIDVTIDSTALKGCRDLKQIYLPSGNHHWVRMWIPILLNQCAALPPKERETLQRRLEAPILSTKSAKQKP